MWNHESPVVEMFQFLAVPAQAGFNPHNLFACAKHGDPSLHSMGWCCCLWALQRQCALLFHTTSHTPCWPEPVRIERDLSPVFDVLHGWVPWILKCISLTADPVTGFSIACFFLPFFFSSFPQSHSKDCWGKGGEEKKNAHRSHLFE